MKIFSVTSTNLMIQNQMNSPIPSQSNCHCYLNAIERTDYYPEKHSNFDCGCGSIFLLDHSSNWQ